MDRPKNLQDWSLSSHLFRITSMPTYQYACTSCGHEFEQFQSFYEDAIKECPECRGEVRKVYTNVGVVFKGGGFYKTDSRPKGESSGEKSAGGGEKSAGSSEKSASATPKSSSPAPKSSGSSE